MGKLFERNSCKQKKKKKETWSLNVHKNGPRLFESFLVPSIADTEKILSDGWDWFWYNHVLAMIWVAGFWWSEREIGR